jgi:hypothetical protein
MTTTQGSRAGDFLEGAAVIAEFMGWSERRIYHIHGTGGWPIFNDGGKITSRRSSLRADVEQREREAMQRGRAGRRLVEPELRRASSGD